MALLPQLQAFEKSVSKVLDEVTPEKEIVNLIKPYFHTLLQTEGLLPEEFRQPKQTKYSQYLLYQPKDLSFSVVAFVWGAGQTAPIHNHLTWGLVGIYEGALEETRYKVVVDDKSGFALQRTGTVVAKKNDISFVFPPNTDIHSVRNPFKDTAISIHVYGKDIGKHQRHLYQDDTFTVNPIVTEHDNEFAIYR
jgi:predicted metal-dependent enzyme (double-stranded beta helix superfamily)